MAGDAAKAAEERGIFERFSQAAGLVIVPGSITQPDPPDIRCEVQGLGLVGFELTRIDSVDELKRMGLFLRSREFWADTLAAQSPAARARLEQLHGNAQVTVGFNPRADQVERRAAMQSVAERLLELDGSYVGSLYPPSDRRGVLVHASIMRTRMTGGPIFNEFSVDWPKQVELNRIDAKLGRDDYRSDARLELLAVVRWSEPTQYDARDFRAYLEERVPGSPFARVWIFEVMGNRVIERYP